MSLASQITLLAQAIGAKIKAITPQLLPSGGAIGQALTKTSATDYATGWSTVVTGPGSSAARGLPVYSDTTGAVLTTSQLTVTTDGALQSNGAGQSGGTVGNARGVGAVDLQSSRNAATQVASGANATVLGGFRNTAAGAYATVAGGGGGSASATGSTIGGGESNVANANYSTVPGGFFGVANRYGMRTQASGRFAAAGDAQRSSYVLRTATTDATATQLTLDGAVPSTAGRFALNAGQSIGFSGMLVATTANAAVAARWDINGLIVRGATAASTRLVGTPTVVQSFADSGASTWAVAVSADTTNGALVFTVTGVAATSIRWVESKLTSEVSF